MTGNLDMGNQQITNLGANVQNTYDVVNLGFCDTKYLQKVSNSDLDMDNHKIKDMAQPTDDNDAVNKHYVDHNFLNRLTPNALGGELDMRGHKLIVLGNPSNPNDASTKAYVDNEISKIRSGANAAILTKTTPQTLAGTIRVPNANLSQITAKDVANIQFLQTYYLSKLAGGVMQNNIQFNESLADNRRQVLYLGAPTDPTSAINKKYFEDKLEQSHLVSSHKTNEFKYLYDKNESSSEYNITVNGIVDFNQSPHQNKKAYDITLIKDSGSNDYRSRIGFNIYTLAIGTYTIVFEFYPPEMTNIQLSCDASEAYIHKAVQRDFTAYSKLLVQFNNNSKQTPNYISLTMHGTVSATPVQLACVEVVSVPSSQAGQAREGIGQKRTKK